MRSALCELSLQNDEEGFPEVFSSLGRRSNVLEADEWEIVKILPFLVVIQFDQILKGLKIFTYQHVRSHCSCGTQYA
jgi:hypothetical protein